MSEDSCYISKGAINIHRNNRRWSGLLALLVTLQVTGSSSDWLQNCNVCHCNWNSGKKTADCKSKGLNAVPEGLNSELQVVDLSNNMIPELKREEFQEANLQNLHKVFMRNCTLLELNRDALKGLAILIELDLSHNFLTELHAGTFEGLVKLRNLVMNNNKIEVLDNFLFAGLEFLSRVEFKHNHLKRIEVHAFGHLPMLSAVYLESNKLKVLRKETFTHTPKLLHLSLAQNLWNCTCELQEFRDYALANRLYTPPTDCRDPPNLRGRLWSEVTSENFACQPRILGSLRSYVEAQSENITLFCRIDGWPIPNITWIYNKRPINSNDHHFKIHNSVEQNYLDNSNMLISELHVYNVRGGDKGLYTCVAENRGGRAETDIQLIVNADYFGSTDSIDVAIGDSASNTQANMMLVLCLVIALLLLFIIGILAIYWYFRRVKTYQKESTMMSENNLIPSKIDKTHKGSVLDGSVIMEMQKSLLTEVNPVEKPPRRTELEYVEGSEDCHDIKKILLDETQFGNISCDDEVRSVTQTDVSARFRHTYVDEGYGNSLPPDLLSFPAHVSSATSGQSSQTNIPGQVIYGLRSPLSSPVYSHVTPHGIYGTTTVTAGTTKGYMTLQHPNKRTMTAQIATSSTHQQQSPFVPAPVVYTPPNTSVIMKQGYMTIPRKPRVPSWTPTSTTQTMQLSDFQLSTPSSACKSESDDHHEPVYDNLGLRTTAGGNSTLKLNKIIQEHPVRYNMRDRPLPETPNVNSGGASASGQHNQSQEHHAPQGFKSPGVTTCKIYEPIHEIAQNMMSNIDSLYDSETQRSDIPMVPNFDNNKSSVPTIESDNKVTKIPPRPPPKPKKKTPMTIIRGQFSASQMFADEDEDGTEV